MKATAEFWGPSQAASIGQGKDLNPATLGNPTCVLPTEPYLLLIQQWKTDYLIIYILKYWGIKIQSGISQELRRVRRI